MNTRYLLLFLIISYTGNLFSQTRGINYKAVITDTNGSPLANQSITVQFTILEGNMAINEVYKETHTTTTDTNGIVIVNIGEGVNISGDFQTINWGLDTHFIKTEVNTGSGFVDLGTTEFKTVPYALYAENSGGSGNVSPFSESVPNRITAVNTNANFVIGSTDMEDQNNVNLDSRMFYDKAKVAFRAGSVDGTQWNNVNRGLYSFAGGRNNTASGVSTTAFGADNQASGFGATVLGRQNTANGSNSLVAGFGNISSNQINAQTVLGKWNEVETDALFIIGNGADDLTRKNILSVKSDGNIIAKDLDVVEITESNALVTKAYVDTNISTPSTGLEQLDEGNGNGWRLIGQDANNYGNIGLNAVDVSTTTFPSTTHGATGSYAFTAGIVTTASGFGATALGNGSTASGDNAFAAGGANIASGENSIALGLNTQATGNSSLAFGEQSRANGNYSFAGGLASIASEQYSFAMGNNADALGVFSFSFGRINSASGLHSFSFGENNQANYNFSFAAGQDNIINANHSTVFGLANNTNGNYSFLAGRSTSTSASYSSAFGHGTRATNEGSMAIGTFNETDSDALFIVGNGADSSNRNTVLKVMDTGVVNIDNLSGTGTRNVSVDASGNLVANSSSDSDILVITPFDFVKENGDNGIAIQRNRSTGTFILVPGDVTEIYAPIQFPKNATITKVEYVYTDLDSQANRALNFSIGFQQFNSSSTATPTPYFVSGTLFNTDNFSSSNKVITADNINFPINSVNSDLWRAYYVRVEPDAGGWSATSALAVLQVRIHYTH